jgi:hypothetical protein
MGFKSSPKTPNPKPTKFMPQPYQAFADPANQAVLKPEANAPNQEALLKTPERSADRGFGSDSEDNGLDKGCDGSVEYECTKSKVHLESDPPLFFLGLNKTKQKILRDSPRKREGLRSPIRSGSPGKGKG